MNQMVLMSDTVFMNENNSVFHKEIGICREQSKNGGCNWGQCDKCGVVPLLYKIFLGKTIEDPVKIKQIKSSEGLVLDAKS